MSTAKKLANLAQRKIIRIAFLCLAALLLAAFPLPTRSGPQAGAAAAGQPPAVPNTACSGGPTIDGILLDECTVETFTVGGVTKTVTVWYTKNTASATRAVDGVTYTLLHGIANDTQAQQVGDWGREAWQRYYEIFNHHPFDTGCGNNINVRLEDGVGWGGIAYWASSGSCWIGIDSPMVAGGGGHGVVYHEFQHYLQYSYNSGCYHFLKDNYNSGEPDGDAEFVEGYADLAEDTVDAALDILDYSGYVSAYNPHESFYDKSYFDVFNKYFAEQLGSLWTVWDPQYHMDAVRRHYEECDAQDTIYVLDTLVPALKPGLTEEALFMNFFAANWAKDWADHVTQPELVYFDDSPPDPSLGPSGPSYGSIPLYKNENLATGSLNWPSETTPDTWAGRYYQVNPQSGCNYLTAQVDGAPGAHLGINLMAAKTTGTPNVQRVARIGEDLVRTFSAYSAGAGGHNRIAAVVNAFGHTYDYAVSFACVTPALEIIEPGYPNYALVGDPTSPIAFLARFRVTSGGAPVLGLSEASFTAQAEGGAVTFVPGSFSQVGEEYWAILLPPTKPLGTTFVDLTACLDGSICQTKTDALLYVNPGTTDFALVFDASGSMNTEDVTGEGKRVDNARRAGTVLADLLRVGDRILVTDFSAQNNPAGCGLPSGSGNCALDLRQLLARTDVTAPASNAITAARTAISNISAREWTPIGAALRDAKNKLMALPANTNHKHIILLSDGEENVNPLYSTLQTELVASGVIIDTIAFSPEASVPLMAQIAADTHGTMRYVPTTSGSRPAEPVPQAQIDVLLQQGMPAALVESLTTAPLPGHLALADVYDYYETTGQDAARLFHESYTGVPDLTWKEKTQYVDPYVTTLRLVVSGKQSDYGGCAGSHRYVEVLAPDADPRQGWVPISPRDATTPASWDVRNSIYDDVAIIPDPTDGNWKIRTRYDYVICRDGVPDAAATAEALSAPNNPNATTDFIMNGSVETEVRLEGRFLPPILNNQGLPGDRVPIVASVIGKLGGIPGLLVGAVVEKPNGVNILLLQDDGLHSDGAAGDGIYGVIYSQTNTGGAYNVRIIAAGAVGPNYATREWMGGFWLKPIYQVDVDKDGLPDPWEEACNLNTGSSHREEDPDHDRLTNYQEFQYGTIPCDPDTDDGGEMDGSEVAGKRNPLYAPDDVVHPLGHIDIQGLNQAIRIRWTHPLSYTNMIAYISTSRDVLGNPVPLGTSGDFTYPNVQNNVKYYVTVVGQNGDADGEPSQQEAVIPKSDPVAPQGAVLINNGAPTTPTKAVLLDISASDTPLDGMFSPGAAAGAYVAAFGDAFSAASGAASGLVSSLQTPHQGQASGIWMRVSNDVTFANATWEPLAPTKLWTLGPGPAGVYRVYVQFRDAADNPSAVTSDSIELLHGLYLPVMYK